MKLFVALNNPVVANAGAALCATSAGALGKDITDLAGGSHPAVLLLVLPFVGIAIGSFMAYAGRPSTIPPAHPTGGSP